MVDEDCLKQVIEKYVKPAEGTLSVDWQFIHSGFKRDICDHLLKVGVLSTRTKDNYGLIAQGGLMNPSLGSSILYFTREEDANKYREAYVEKPIYKINLVKFQD